MLKKLKFCIAALFAICLLSAGNSAHAAPICPVPTEVTQPDGTVITVTAYGDEFFSWKEDENGNVIAYDEATDSYKYAGIEDGILIPTSETVGKPSLSRRASKRLQREDIMPLWENAERTDYTQPCGNGSIALMSADEEPEQEKPLTHQKLLTLLIEFNDVKLKYDGAFWAKQMYSTNPKDISVVNYWKENSNGLDVFEPAYTSNVQDGANGTISYGNYTDIGYTITKCPEGVVKVSLDMPHPIKTWNNQSGDIACDTAILAFRAVEPYFDFTKEQPYLITIFAGYDTALGKGAGKGQMNAFASIGGINTVDGISLGRVAFQGEMFHDTYPAGIGVTCHELGHTVFYLPDLYFNDAIGATPECGVCSYSLMSSGCHGHRCNSSMKPGTPLKIGELPSHLDPWCKIQCGFVTPTLVNEWDGNLNSISENGVDSKYNVLEIRSKSAPNQYFLVENRQLIGYDKGLEEANNYYASNVDIGGGIIIWHIDGSVFKEHNGSSLYHSFMRVERSTNEWSPTKWAYTGAQGRNAFKGETTPNSNLYKLKSLNDGGCARYKDCHPQTLKSGISIEVLGENGPSVRVKANVDEEYRVSMMEGAKFSELFPDPNFCNAIIDILQEKDGITRKSDDVLSIRDWATLVSINAPILDGYGIKDLTGIEYFTILDTLVCNNNEIATFAPLTPEQIQRIDTFSCANNNLTELDLTGWENLTWFYCNDNQLTSLTLPANENLSRIECQNNRLTTLDLTNTPGVQFLFCYGNYMDAETPGNSILGMDTLWEELGPPFPKDDPDTWFPYYPQNVPGVEHNWDSAWQKDDTHHWHNCTDADCSIVNNADKDGYGEHIPGKWETVTPATMKQEGLRVKKCTVCQTELQRESIPKLKPTSPTPSTPGPSEPDPPDDDPTNCSKDGNCPLAIFSDTGTSVWYHDGIHFCVENGLMNGEGNGKFAPNAALTRGMLAQILYNNAGRPAVTGNNPFDDVNSGTWYANAVAWAAESGIASGYGKGRFGPNDPITREQLAVMLYRHAGSPTSPNLLLPFDDAENVGDYALDALRWAVEKDIMNGKGNGILDPKGRATRAEVAAMLMRYCEVFN